MKSSVKPLHAANDNMIDRTLGLWKPRLGRDLSREDARQIVENVTGFFAVLIEWSRAERRVPALSTGDDPGAVRQPPRSTGND